MEPTVTFRPGVAAEAPGDGEGNKAGAARRRHGQRITRLARRRARPVAGPLGSAGRSAGIGPSTLPPNFISPNVPHDVPAGSAATVAQLAVFAWQEFIALNWVAMNPGTTSVRGRPDTAVDPNAGFLGIAPDGNGNFPLVVWQTYRHKNELFPADGNTATSFDSTAPTYKYTTQPHGRDGRSDPELQSLQQSRRDEPDRLGLHVRARHVCRTAPECCALRLRAPDRDPRGLRGKSQPCGIQLRY